MADRTTVSLVHRRALKQALLHSSRVPDRAFLAPGALVRSLRSALLMTQAQLARRSKVPQAHIARLEAGADIRFTTLTRLLDALFCDWILLPRPRRRLGDALAEREMENPYCRGIWD